MTGREGLTGVTKHLLALLVLALAAPVVASCASSAPEPPSIYGNPPALEEYLGILLPGLAAMKELDQLDPELYASLVRDFREGGLEALEDAGRSSLLLVAQVAFLSHAETLRWSATSRDASPDTELTHDGEATIEEVYVRRPYSPTQSTVSHLAARRGMTDRICWSWGLTPYWDPDCWGELRLFVDFVSGEQHSEVDTAIITQWGSVDGQWICYRNAPMSSYRYYAAELDYWGLFARIAKATLSDHDTLDGQRAYRFEDYQDRSVQYWLNAESLWLRQYQYEDSSGALITVKLEAVNEDIFIEPPDVDVECVEEEAQ